jgi:multiple antibiotic resistance protein
MSNFFHDFVLTFLPLFIVVDALGNVPIIISLSDGMYPQAAQRCD